MKPDPECSIEVDARTMTMCVSFSGERREWRGDTLEGLYVFDMPAYWEGERWDVYIGSAVRRRHDIDAENRCIYIACTGIDVGVPLPAPQALIAMMANESFCAREVEPRIAARRVTWLCPERPGGSGRPLPVSERYPIDNSAARIDFRVSPVEVGRTEMRITHVGQHYLKLSREMRKGLNVKFAVDYRKMSRSGKADGPVCVPLDGVWRLVSRKIDLRQSLPATPINLQETTRRYINTFTTVAYRSIPRPCDGPRINGVYLRRDQIRIDPGTAVTGLDGVVIEDVVFDLGNRFMGSIRFDARYADGGEPHCSTYFDVQGNGLRVTADNRWHYLDFGVPDVQLSAARIWDAIDDYLAYHPEAHVRRRGHVHRIVVGRHDRIELVRHDGTAVAEFDGPWDA